MMPVVSIDTTTGLTNRYEHVGRGKVKRAGAVEWVGPAGDPCAHMDASLIEEFRQRGMEMIPDAPAA